MKTEYMLIGYSAGNTMPHLFARNGNFISYNMPESLNYAKRWTTRAGAERFIKAEQKAVSDWSYLVMPVESAGASQAASSLGKLGAGIPKTITADESQARRERLAVARAKRWA